jgi:hypothetical protein
MICTEELGQDTSLGGVDVLFTLQCTWMSSSKGCERREGGAHEKISLLCWTINDTVVL